MTDLKCEGADHGWNDTEIREYNCWSADGQSFKAINLCRRCEEGYLKTGVDLRNTGSFRCPECKGWRFGTEGTVEGYSRFCMGRLKNTPYSVDEAEYDPCQFKWPAEDDEKYGLGESPMSFAGFEEDPVHDSIPAPAL